MTDETVVGKLGIVTHPIKKGRLGEIILSIRGGSEVYMARSETPLDTQTEVLVIEQISSRTVQVVPFIV